MVYDKWRKQNKSYIFELTKSKLRSLIVVKYIRKCTSANNEHFLIQKMSMSHSCPKQNSFNSHYSVSSVCVFVCISPNHWWNLFTMLCSFYSSSSSSASFSYRFYVCFFSLQFKMRNQSSELCILRVIFLSSINSELILCLEFVWWKYFRFKTAVSWFIRIFNAVIVTFSLILPYYYGTFTIHSNHDTDYTCDKPFHNLKVVLI